jgi:hypothetical protein
MRWCTAIKKEKIMSSLNISAIDRQARQMRAEEMQRIQGVFAERLRLYGQLLAATFMSALGAIGAGVRPLFSWNPQARHHS